MSNTLPVASFLQPSPPLRVVDKPQDRAAKMLAMARATTPKVSKAKSEQTPRLVVAEAKELTDAFPQLCADWDDIDARYKQAVASLCEIAEPKRRALSREMKTMLSSVRINGILYTFKPPHWAKALRGERVDAAMEAFGERFESFFSARLPKTELRPDQIAVLEAAGCPYDVEFVGTDLFHDARTLEDSVRLACAKFPELSPIQSVSLK